MTDETEPAPEAQNSQLVDASGRFETKRDMVLLEEAVTEARSMGLSAFTDGKSAKERLLTFGLKHAEHVLKDRARVPVFAFLGVWSLLAAYMNYEKNAFGTLILIGFLALSFALIKDAIDWASVFDMQKRAQKEHLDELRK
ncbi:MAG: hypothetical protein O9286_15705 [Aquidulcibacter sp.]|jgi:hypothetical protein|uniref:hypothetical protein n=1 Tax=Aquidulcibacter sp. TaxID=2052990 RepID=UPI0022BA9A79|nr:hypothetical protein [Aquidulcibacter sp.]